MLSAVIAIVRASAVAVPSPGKSSETSPNSGHPPTAVAASDSAAKPSTRRGEMALQLVVAGATVTNQTEGIRS